MFAKGVRELDVYKLAFALQQRIFQITKRFPKEEMYSLTDQIRRSSRSVGGNVAEAWGKRRYPAHFVSKLTDAVGEAEETMHWTVTANACEYVDEPTRNELLSQYEHVIGMLSKMQSNPQAWTTRPR